MDDQQTAALELDGHHLEGHPVRVVAEVDQPWIGVGGRAGGRRLLEPQPAVLNDVA